MRSLLVHIEGERPRVLKASHCSQHRQILRDSAWIGRDRTLLVKAAPASRDLHQDAQLALGRDIECRP